MDGTQRKRKNREGGREGDVSVLLVSLFSPLFRLFLSLPRRVTEGRERKGSSRVEDEEATRRKKKEKERRRGRDLKTRRVRVCLCWSRGASWLGGCRDEADRGKQQKRFCLFFFRSVSFHLFLAMCSLLSWERRRRRKESSCNWRESQRRRDVPAHLSGSNLYLLALWRVSSDS